MSRATQVPAGPGWVRFAYGAVTLCGSGFRRIPLRSHPARWRRSYNPGRRVSTPPVWAPPRSLAATCGIIVIFSSCGYLDVSVPRVRLGVAANVGIAPHGLPHSDIRGSKGICPSPRLFAACRVLLRLREPQASPMRPSSLSFFLSPCSCLCARRRRPCLSARAALDCLARSFRAPPSPRPGFRLSAADSLCFFFICVSSMSMSSVFFLRSPRQS